MKQKKYNKRLLPRRTNLKYYFKWIPDFLHVNRNEIPF